MSGEQLPGQFIVRAVTGLPDFRPGDDLAAALCQAAPWLADGDIVAITSKAVSKCEGRLVTTGVLEDERTRARQQAIDAETAAVVAQRGNLRIVRTRQGMTMAAAGVDASNVNADEIALLPLDPDASARAIRDAVRARLGRDVAVIVTDTAGRPWRDGLVDIALGAAGIPALRDLRGSLDTHGHPLAVTALAQIDELAAASELVRGKLGRVAAAVIRGIPWDDAGPGAGGAASLIRAGDSDMFSLGTRDVVPATRRAVPDAGGGPADLAPLVADAVQRMQPAPGIETAVQGSSIRVRCDDPFERGLYVGQLLVALRAEGLTAVVTRTAHGATLETALAAPYAGTPR